MSDNSAVLRSGQKIARQVISLDISSRLGALMQSCVGQMTSHLKDEVPGMTGNTQTSASGGTYIEGRLTEVNISGSNDGMSPPLSAKLRKGNVFKAGRQRYDGGIQESDFKADVDTTGNQSQKDNLDFLESQEGEKGFKMLIVGGTEYLGQVQVSDNFAYCQNNVDRFFKPDN